MPPEGFCLQRPMEVWCRSDPFQPLSYSSTFLVSHLIVHKSEYRSLFDGRIYGNVRRRLGVDGEAWEKVCV